MSATTLCTSVMLLGLAVANHHDACMGNSQQAHLAARIYSIREEIFNGDYSSLSELTTLQQKVLESKKTQVVDKDLGSSNPHCDAGSISNTPAQVNFRNDFNAREKAMLQNVWPMDLLEDPTKQARVVNTVDEFLRAVLVGDHLDTFVVFPNGISALNLTWKETVPGDLQQFFEGRKTGEDLARGIVEHPEFRQKYKARLDLYGGEHSIFDDTQKERKQFPAAVKKALKMVEDGVMKPDDMYFAEVTYRQSRVRRNSKERRVTIFNRDLKDLFGPYVLWNWKWDNENAGLFVGGRLSGTGLHVDQEIHTTIIVTR